MKVVISARNFCFDGCGADELLSQNGFEVINLSDMKISDEEYEIILSEADIIINGFEKMSAPLIRKCKNLKLISIRGVGYDYIDIDECQKQKIALTRTVGCVGEAVSEQVIAYIMHFAREVQNLNANMQKGEWQRIMTDGAFGKTVGIIGFGEIGSSVARKAAALGMRVAYTCKSGEKQTPYEFKSLDELLRISDYVILALPLNSQTENMIDEKAFSLMKENAVLINVARSKIVDNQALKNAAKSGKIKGAAVDVFESEPCTNSILKGAQNIILTPHTAPFTKSNFINMNTRASLNVIEFFSGALEEKYRLL